MRRLLLLLLGLTITAAVLGAAPSSDKGAAHAAFKERLAACDRNVDCEMEVARWAAGQGLLHEADLLYRRILIHNPLLTEPYDALVVLNRNRDLPKESRSYREARALLTSDFVEYETRRFIVLSNADPHWSRSQAEHLERAHHQFMRYVNRMQLRPLPLRHKLVCVLFEHQRDYQTFAAANDGIGDPWIVGYYSPRHDRVVFYHRSDDDETNDALSRRVSIATTIHEAVHQLHFHTRVKSLQVQYPLWICEGLATAFETDTPNSAFGPDHEYQPRRDRFHAVLAQEELMPLHQLVSLTRMPDGKPATVRAVYHQSYALVVWLHRYRPAELRQYLNLMLMEPHGQVSESRQVELFEKAFGRLDAIERAWLTHERRALAMRTDDDYLQLISEPDRYAMRTCACVVREQIAAHEQYRPNRLAIGVPLGEVCNVH